MAHSPSANDRPQDDQQPRDGELYTTVEIPSDALLTRAQTGTALRGHGYPVADATLATKATRGGGPPFRHFGARVLYRWGDSLAWAQARLTPAVTSTSELDAIVMAAGHTPGRGAPQST